MPFACDVVPSDVLVLELRDKEGYVLEEPFVVFATFYCGSVWREGREDRRPVSWPAISSARSFSFIITSRFVFCIGSWIIPSLAIFRMLERFEESRVFFDAMISYATGSTPAIVRPT